MFYTKTANCKDNVINWFQAISPSNESLNKARGGGFHPPCTQCLLCVKEVLSFFVKRIFSDISDIQRFGTFSGNDQKIALTGSHNCPNMLFEKEKNIIFFFFGDIPIWHKIQFSFKTRKHCPYERSYRQIGEVNNRKIYKYTRIKTDRQK